MSLIVDCMTLPTIPIHNCITDFGAAYEITIFLWPKSSGGNMVVFAIQRTQQEKLHSLTGIAFKITANYFCAEEMAFNYLKPIDNPDIDFF